jgi:hypothetical protein
MVHLNRPVEAMRAIRTALKPGGVMVCEEADVSAVYAEPPSHAYDGMREIALKAGLARGVEEGAMTEARWTELVDGMTQAVNSRETVVAACTN